MPDYLIMLHAYGTWMPDRDEGSFHWKRGYQARNAGLARSYRSRQRESPAMFDAVAQRVLIDALLETAALKQIIIHADCD